MRIRARVERAEVSSRTKQTKRVPRRQRTKTCERQRDIVRYMIVSTRDNRDDRVRTGAVRRHS